MLFCGMFMHGDELIERMNEAGRTEKPFLLVST